MDELMPDTVVSPGKPEPAQSRRWAKVLLAILGVIAIIACSWYAVNLRTKSKATPTSRGKSLTIPGVENRDTTPKVEIVHPSVGGIERVCVQPGTVEPYESADLFAKVSGFLAEQTVDIGTHVKVGQLLARIDVPELTKQVERDQATLEHERSKVVQMESHIHAAEAEAKAASFAVPLARSTLKARVAYRKYREKQLARLTELQKERAIEPKIVDESQDQYESSIEAESAAQEGVSAAEQKAVAAQARVEQAKADLLEAKASVRVAEAELERSKVFLGYTQIVSPYNGVITKRSFFRGDFIRSADSGGDRVPLLSVERTDMMRVVVQVPDRDVPYVDVGDTAEIETDAIPGKNLRAKVSRMASSEDTATRTMRTECDVPNPDGKLRRGMYGRVSLILDKGRTDVLTVPTSVLQEKIENSQTHILVVRDGVVRKIPVLLGSDNGIRVEVLKGIAINDKVVFKSNVTVEEGQSVNVVEAKKPSSSDH